MVPLKGNRKSSPTKKNYYLHVSVFSISVVFCQIFNPLEMKRTVDENITSGLYYDFINSLAPPLVLSLIPDIRKNKSGKIELDTYIRTAIEYRDLFRMDKTA